MMGVDPRRFGPYATGRYLREKVEEAYRKVFTVHYQTRSAKRRGRPNNPPVMTVWRLLVRFSAASMAGNGQAGSHHPDTCWMTA